VTPLFVAGVGVVAPGLRDWPLATRVLSGLEDWQETSEELPVPAILPKNERRRSTPSIRLALEAARQAVEMADMPARTLPTVFGSACGDGDVIHALLESVSGVEPRVSPTQFHNSVHNAPAGYWCIASACREPALSIGAFDATVPATLLTAAVQACRRAVLTCVYDAPLPEPLHGVRRFVMPFGAAMVLSPEPTRGALGRLEVAIGARGLAPSSPRTARLMPLFEGNPAARLLPVLEALARREAREVVLGWDDTSPLVVAVTPC
jgi:hypothetical protein